MDEVVDEVVDEDEDGTAEESADDAEAVRTPALTPLSPPPVTVKLDVMALLPINMGRGSPRCHPGNTSALPALPRCCIGRTVPYCYGFTEAKPIPATHHVVTATNRIKGAPFVANLHSPCPSRFQPCR